MSESIAYPPPPWTTVGRAFFQPYAVPASALDVPPGLEPEIALGRSVGLLGLVEYVSPSPLAYRELLWMPCRVRARAGGRTLRGFWVARMVVDSVASVAAGRAEWALPKTLARFDVDEEAGTARVETEPGERFELRFGARAWLGRGSAPSRVATLAIEGGALVRFRSEGRARVSSGRLEVTHESGADPWPGLAEATRVRGAGTALTRFETTMLAAERLALDGAPA